MKKFIFLFIIFLPALSFGQDERQTLPIDLFYEGQAVLQNGDTLKGLVKYSDHDVLQVMHDQRTDIYTPQLVLSFEINDRISNCRRQFYALPYTKKGQEKSIAFFELISKGKITLMSKERLQPRTAYVPSGGLYLHITPIHWEVVNDYFLLKDNGSLEHFPRAHGKWYELMGNQASMVKDYARKNKLDLDKKCQFKSIVDYYNSLFRKQSIFSSAKTSDPRIQ